MPAGHRTNLSREKERKKLPRSLRAYVFARASTEILVRRRTASKQARDVISTYARPLCILQGWYSMYSLSVCRAIQDNIQYVCIASVLCDHL
jgi:hypothetical protein